MNKIDFKYCPICSGELDTGKIKFPAPHAITEWIEAEGKYYSDKTAEEYEGHPIRKLFNIYDKEFTVQTFGANNPAGYCKNCGKIFAEFEVIEF